VQEFYSLALSLIGVDLSKFINPASQRRPLE